MNEPKRCGQCGTVARSDGVTCPVCHKPRLRVLTGDERRAWEQTEGEGEDMARKAVAVRCEFR